MRDAFHSVADFAAVLAAGQAQAEARGGSVGQGQGQDRLQEDRAGSRGSRRTAGLRPGRNLCVTGWRQGRLVGKRSRDRAEAGVRQGQCWWQRNWSAGCSTWLFKFDLMSLRSFFHLMLCKNWFYLPLIFFFFSLPLLLWMNN